MGYWQSALENMVTDKKFWNKKVVLVTGHTGFKGSWLVLWLKHLGAEVIGVSLDPPSQIPSLYELSSVSRGMLSLRQDIRDGKKIKEIFQQYRPEVVFHLAAQPLVRYSYRKPVETYETNVMGSLHILEGIRSVSSVRAAVMITTDKCYENKEWEWGYRENEPMGGYDPYSSSKGSAELLISSYRNSYYPTSQYESHKTAIASARAGNVIGGGDWAEDRLIPDIIRAFEKGEQAKIRRPCSIRPWQHVLEPLSGYIQLAELLVTDGSKYSEAWNFGPRDDDVRPVEWIVEYLAKQWRNNASWSLDDSKKHPHEANYLKLDCSKAHARLNWHPKWDLRRALLEVVRWHKEGNKNAKFEDICMTQIREYMEGL